MKKDNNITNYIKEKPKRSTSKNNRKGDTKLMDENQKDFLRSQLEGYIQRNGVDTHKAKFQCAICGDKDGANFVPNTNRTVWKCFSAKHSGYAKDSEDIFDYVQQLNYAFATITGSRNTTRWLKFNYTD